MMKYCQPSLPKMRFCSNNTIHRTFRRNVRIAHNIHRALPVKIIRVTVENMMNRIIHISQPNQFWYGSQTDLYCVGMEETNEYVVHVAFGCIMVIIVLYIILVLLMKYEKENE